MGYSREELIASARAAAKYAYVPYSGYPVGAALLCADGRVFTGCNVENSSYPAGICAERTALVKAVSEGARDFVMLAVAGPTDEPCYPCGICRQMLYEFAPDLAVLCAGADGSFIERSLRELLPGGFVLEGLK